MEKSNLESAAVARRLHPLVRELLARPRSFQFFQAVLLLSKSFPEKTEPGLGNDARSDLIHFRSWPHLTRSGTDIRSLRIDPDAEADDAFEMEVAFLGLYGLSSPTPSYFWEYVVSHPESALRDFLDVFASRWIGLFHQAWKRYRWPLVYRGMNDPMTRRVFCLMGLGTELHPTKPDLFSDSFEKETTILAQHEALSAFPNRLRLLAFAGLLSQYTRPPCNVSMILSEYFDARLGKRGLVDVEENVFQWAYLDPRDQTRLGRANSKIGASYAFIAGTRIPDRMGAFRVHLGPLTLARFLEFLPDRSTFRTLTDLVRMASPFGLEFDVDLSLLPHEVPKWKLGGVHESGLGRLGWTCFCGDEPRSEPGVVRLRPNLAT